jgi:hypothetical protein
MRAMGQSAATLTGNFRTAEALARWILMRIGASPDDGFLYTRKGRREVQFKLRESRGYAKDNLGKVIYGELPHSKSACISKSKAAIG